jgi:sec-independent protein translocase protein TatA
MENVFFAGVIGPTQIILILVVVILLFGAKKLPDLMRGVGKGIRGFKEEMNGTAEESKDKIEK